MQSKMYNFPLIDIKLSNSFEDLSEEELDHTFVITDSRSKQELLLQLQHSIRAV